MEQHNLSEGTVADLIDSVSHAWKPKLVRALYPGPISQEVLRLPISKTGSVSDRLDWRHSSSGDYRVKKAYELIARDSGGYNQSLWHLIWKPKEAFSSCSAVTHRPLDQQGRFQFTQKPWQLIIKVAGARAKKLHRAAFAYEVRNLQGEVILQSVQLYREYGCSHYP
ncbi:hypothetical protein SO802_012028 [Lithocarpus litseifolius]|uniref:Uncharacterized protein n=1 Tax=Lithocarpus litseifolius TaxID=425828 RepID=A0AAW2D295_9ROSI